MDHLNSMGIHSADITPKKYSKFTENLFKLKDLLSKIIQ
jgi:hypothetical protein